MARIVFIGDELTAAGYRLGGVQVTTPPPERIVEVFRATLAAAPLLVLIGAEYAAALPADELSGALIAQRPPLLVVDPVADPAARTALRRHVRTQLGLATTA